MEPYDGVYGTYTCKQAEQKQHHDRRSKSRCLFAGSQIKVRNYRGDTKWIPGTVLKKFGPVTYSVDIRDGRTVKRHLDQLHCTLKRLSFTQVHIKHDR